MLDLIRQESGEAKRKLTTSLARTESEMQEAQRIRFKVFCGRDGGKATQCRAGTGCGSF